MQYTSQLHLLQHQACVDHLELTWANHNPIALFKLVSQSFVTPGPQWRRHQESFINQVAKRDNSHVNEDSKSRNNSAVIRI